MYDPNYDIPDKDTRRWAMFIHLSGLTMLTGIPLANLVFPLVLWLAKRDEHPFIDDQGREAINFHISFTIYLLVAVCVMLVLLLVLVGVLLVPLVIAIPLAQLGLSVYAAIKANDGEPYRYPFTIRLL